MIQPYEISKINSSYRKAIRVWILFALLEKMVHT